MIAQKIVRFVAKKLSRETKTKLIVLRKNFSLPQWYLERTADVFLISFPKCGRTWLTLMIGRSIEQHFGLKNANLLELHQLSPMRPEIPRIVVTHDDRPQWKLADEVERSKSRYRDKKVILLVRDPRDVIVSSYFQKKKRKRAYTKTLSEYLHEPIGGFDSLLRFYDVWSKNRMVPKDFLLVRYEDMHAAPQLQLRRVLDFVGLSAISEATVASAVDYCSFENMRRMEESDQHQSHKLRPKDQADEESYKTRKGRVGGFREHLTESELEFLSRRMEESVSELYGYRP